MKPILSELGLSSTLSGTRGSKWYSEKGAHEFASTSPIDGKVLGSLTLTTEKGYEQVVNDAHETFLEWRKVPAPERGLIVREIGEALRDYKELLGKLVTLETGKIYPEGLGEIQEAIDIADFAVGLSRQLYGKTMHSERPAHRMYEQWHPLGVVGVITAFNFPAAVWAWNAMLAAVCGDTVIWKPSEQAPLTAIAMTKVCAEIAERNGFPGLFSLVTDSGPDIGKKIAADRRIPLVSATGSCAMGRSVAEAVGRRLGKTILELGGNNAVIVMDDADLSLVIPSVLFGAVGTAGQRCTSARRVLVHEKIADEVMRRLKTAYAQVKIGDPMLDTTLMGPLINKRSVQAYVEAIQQIKEQGGELVCGGKVIPNMPSDLYVEPTIIRAKASMPIVQQETFAPILYVIPVKDLDEAIALNNGVAQGLSSGMFTESMKNAERFLSHEGSDCGIANINIGTSGAEIGGAFGGEKDTGGGRESGSDSWKQYMRRQTNTINYSRQLPLAQGIRFSVE